MRTRRLLFLIFTFLCFSVLASGAENKPVVSGDLAPTFVLRNREGGYTKLRDYCDVKGGVLSEDKKYPVVLTFFSSICIPCITELPIIHKIAEEYKPKGVVFFLVSTDSHPEEVLPDFIKERNITLPILLDLYKVVFTDNFHIETVPHTYVIDRDRKIIASFGSETRDIEKELRKAIGTLFQE